MFALAFALLLSPVAARAFDPFNLFGDGTPEPSRQALPYAITFDVGDGGSDLEQALKDASNLYKLREDAPQDGATLVRRAETDLIPLLDALLGAGHYNASVTVEVAGVAIRQNGNSGAASAAAERYRARERVPVRIAAVPGPLFQLREIVVLDARTRQPFAPDDLPPRVVKIAPGDPARSSDLRATQAAIVDHFRYQSYPLAKAIDVKPVVYHRLERMDVTFVVDRGPRAPFGQVTVSGRSDVDPRVVRSYIYIEPGDPYSPKVIADTRRSVLQIPAISSVRLREAERLDADGQLPVDAAVTDRLPRVVGFSARYSTLDGPAVRGYWQHRNLFGGAESLRLEADLFVPPRGTQDVFQVVQNFTPDDFGGRFRAAFVKPALSGTRNDLLLDAMVERDRTGGDQFGGYDSRRALASAAIRHRFTQFFSAQVGLAGEVGRTTDTLGTVDYTLIGVPAQVNYDSTDKLLDPSEGFRVLAQATPYPAFLGSSVEFTEFRARVSGYYAFDEAARVILAGRVTAGSLIGGAALADIPSTHRFYAGGGGSVRGYRYRSLSPLDANGLVIGGKNLVEGSFEARVKITDTIGLVPFYDVGGAFDSNFSNFGEELRSSVGLGLRYYTGIGPIRVDVALPVNRRPGDPSYAFYLGIGQAF